MELEITRTDPQKKFMNSDKKFRAFVSGVGAGKTAAGWMSTLEYSFDNPGSLGVIVAPTYSLIRDVILRERETWIPDELILSYNKTDKEMKFINGSTILFRSANDEKQIELLRGLSIAWSWIDEATLLPKLILEILMARLRQPGFDYKLWMTCTPRKGWLHDMITKGLSDEWFILDKIPTASNTFLPEGYVDSLRDLYTGQFYDQEVMGQWVDFEGLVWQIKKFTDDINPRKVKNTTYGIDIGFTHPTAITVIQAYGGKYYVVDEFYKSHTNDDDVIMELRRLQNQWGAGRVWVDPSVPRVINEINKAGFSAQGADNKVMDGLRVVRAHFDTGKLFVHERCENLIREMDGYVWKDGDKERPIDVNDDACDALRYGLMGVTRHKVHKSAGVVRGK